jgi:hypothetical protein
MFFKEILISYFSNILKDRLHFVIGINVKVFDR